MSKFVFLFLSCCLLIPSPAPAATPFQAPATFDLAGSSIAFSASVETQRLGVRDLTLNPNPAPVTGYLDIDELSSKTGIFFGALRDVSTRTTATIPIDNKTFTVEVSISGDSVSGIFLWTENKVVFYPETLTATFTVNGISQQVPFTGIPLPADYNDGVISLSAEQSANQEVYGYPVQLSAAVDLTGNLDESGQAGDQLWLAIQTSKENYFSGDTLTLYASAGNPGASRQAEFYLLMLDPSGNPFLAPEYINRLAALKTATLDAGAYAPPTAVLQVKLPAFTPPVTAKGEYQFAAAFMDANSGEMVSNLTAVSFSFDPETQSGNAPAETYDGLWVGSGTSDVVTADCPALAQVQFEIAQNALSGWADDGEDGYELTGTVNDNGEVADGVLLEEFGPNWVPMGSFNGTFANGAFSGRWVDNYGCHGSVSLTKFE